MRRLIVVPMIGMTLALAGCKREETPATKQAAPAAPLVSVLNMSDPQAASQLTRGFWNLENNAWRWTMSKFAVTLRTPAGAAQTGARLDMNLTLPPDSLVPVTLSATAGGVALEPEKYSKSGVYVFTRDVPASVLSGDKITIEFATDKIQPQGADKRELALVVTKVGLVAK
jgi:hypothetical protein